MAGTLGAIESHYDKFNSVCNIMHTGVDQDQPTMTFLIPTIFRFLSYKNIPVSKYSLLQSPYFNIIPVNSFHHVCMYTLSSSAISILAPTSIFSIHFLRSPRSQPASNRSCKYHGTHTHRVLPLNHVNPLSRSILKTLQYIC